MLTLAKKLNQTGNLLSIDQLGAAGFKPRNFDRRYTSNSNWPRIAGMRMLQGATVGIIGLGELGREPAMRAHAFGMKIVYYQRTRRPQAEERAWHGTYQTLDPLLAENDCVCPML